MDQLQYITLINHYLKNRYLDAASKATKRHITLQSKSFKVEVAEFYRITKTGTVRKATCSDEADELIRILQSEKIKERYWWPGMSKHVCKFCNNCLLCYDANPNNKLPAYTQCLLLIMFEHFIYYSMVN